MNIPNFIPPRKPFSIIIDYSENNAPSHSFFLRPKPKSFHLPIHKSLVNALQLLPQNFTITTNNGSAKFNIDILKYTSSTLFQFLQNGTDNLQYNLPIHDDLNVLEKLKQLYQGKIVFIEKNEIQTFLEIIQFLQISISDKNIVLCLSTKIIDQLVFPTKARFDFCSLIDTLNADAKFVIKTNKNEYICNSIGVHLSAVISKFILSNPQSNVYSYDFPDEFDEFQPICDFFNFKEISITTSNMESTKKIAEDLKIDFIINKTDPFIDIYEKFSETLDEQQDSIDQINELFEFLYDIKQKTVETVKNWIIQSKWSRKEENVQELGAFILQVINSSITFHCYMLDLLIKLDAESNDTNKLKILLPLVIDNLMNSFGINIQNCSFVYLLHKKEIISEKSIMECLRYQITDIQINMDKFDNNDCNENNNPNINTGSIFNSFLDLNRSNKKSFLKINTPTLLWFLPEIIKLKKLENFDLIQGYGSAVDSFIQFYFNQIDLYKKMRDKGCPDDELTLALRNDDIDKFQSIVATGNFDVDKGTVPYNIFEEFVPNGKTKYLNYAAAYGSIKCFKYILLNHDIVDMQTFKFAVYGGNTEIVKIVEQNLKKDDFEQEEKSILPGFGHNKHKHKKIFQNDNCLFDYKRPTFVDNYDNNVSNFIDEIVYNNSLTYFIVPSIIKHQNDLFDWLLEKNLSKNTINNDSFTDLVLISCESGNAHSLVELFDKYFEYAKAIFSKREPNETLIEYIIEIICKKGFYLMMKIVLNLFEKLIAEDQNYLLLPDGTTQRMRLIKFFFSEDPLKLNGFFAKIPKMYTISFGNLSILKLFIHKFDQRDFEAILSVVIATNNTNAIKYIFENLVKKNVFKITENNISLFITYALLSKTEKYIIEQVKSTNPSAMDNFSWTMPMLENASIANNISATKYISEILFAKNPKQDFFTPFMNAVFNNSVELCNFFIDKKMYISYNIIHKRALLISKANKDIFTIILNNAPQKKLHKLYENLYMYAIENQNAYIVEHILKTNQNICNELLKAVEVSNLEIVKIILKYNHTPKFVNKRTPHGTALIVAVKNNDFKIVKELLSVPGIDANLYDASQNTALTVAFDKNNLDIFNAILDFYGDKIQDQEWQLSILLKKVTQLIQKKSNPKVKEIINRVLGIDFIDKHIICLYNVMDINCNNNKTILEFACEQGEIDIVNKLLESETIDINRYDPISADTILIKTIKMKNIEIVEALIKYPKTDINFRNNFDQTPFTVAVQENLLEIVELLLKDERFDKEESLFNCAFSISTGKITNILLDSKYFDINDNIYTCNNHPFDIKTNDKLCFVNKFSDNYIQDTLLMHAVRNQNELMIDIIVHHPSFDKKKSKLNKAVILSAGIVMNIQIFKKLIELIDIDDFNKKYADYLLNSLTYFQSLNNEEYNKNKSLKFGILLEVLQIPNIVFGKNELKETFNKLFSGATFNQDTFSLNVLEKIIEYDRSHNNYIDLNEIQFQNHTCLTFINKYSGIELLSFLFKFGSDPNLPDKLGILPLQYAFYTYNDEFIKYYVTSCKIDFDKKVPDVLNDSKSNDNYNWNSDLFELYNRNVSYMQKNNHISYLHLAARYKNPLILKLFLDMKLIDVNVTDDLGNTPLIDACIFNRGSNVETLFQIDDLDYRHCNKEGKDALHVLDISSPDDDRATNDKNDYLKKLMIHLDKNESKSPQNQTNILPPADFANTLNPPNQTNILPPADFANTFNPPNHTNLFQQLNFANARNPPNQTNILPPADFANTLNPPNQTNLFPSLNFANARNPPNQTSTHKSLDQLKELGPFNHTNQRVFLNQSSDASLLDQPNQVRTFNQQDQANTLTQQVLSSTLNQAICFDSLKNASRFQPAGSAKSFDSPNYANQASTRRSMDCSSSPNLKNASCQTHSTSEPKRPSNPFRRRREALNFNDDERQQDLHFSFSQNSGVFQQQVAQYQTEYQSLFAQQQIDQMILESESNQILFNQQMMQQTDLIMSMKRRKSKRKKMKKSQLNK